MVDRMQPPAYFAALLRAANGLWYEFIREGEVMLWL